MGYSKKFLKKLEEKINRGKTHNERVKISFKCGFMILTKPVSDSISEEYELIENAINDLDIKDPLMPLKKHELIALKKQVPKRHSVSSNVKAELQEIINAILGKRRNDDNW